jgi:glycosyltransferase involved in cell wall biosynthesis
MKRTKYNHIEKTKVIYNSIITSRLKRMAEDDGINVGTGKKIIGFVGGLYEEGKGLKYLIKAFYKVKQEVSNSMLVIVGDGPDKQKLISLAKNLNLEEDVIFTGFKENPVQYMKGFDLMVLPSLHEAFGAVILEALYVGTPVIGSRIGGIPEVLKYEELLFKPRNVDDLSSKIINLLKNNEVRRKAVDLCRERKGVFT